MYPFRRNIQLFRKVNTERFHNPIKVSVLGNVVFIVLFHFDFRRGD